MAPNLDPTSNTTSPTLAILGTAANYNTTSGAFTGGSNLQTSSENIPIYTQSDGTSASASANVTYTRTTTVSPTSLTYSYTSTGATTTSTLNAVLFTVTVSYLAHDQTYSTTMSTLRNSD